MRKWKLLIAIVTFSVLFTTLSAQRARKTPDKIIQTNGKVIECKITSIDSTKINLVYKTAYQKVQTFIFLDDLASYIYKGEEVHLRDVEEQIYFPDLVEKKKPNVLHVGDQPSAVLRLSLFVPAIIVEAKTGSHSTLLMSFWTGFIYSKTTINGETTESFKLIPGLTIGPRFYTTLQSRAAKGKRVDYFSSMYMGIPASISFFEDYKFLTIGAVAGFQRTLGRKAFWNIGIGMGMNWINSEVNIEPIGEFGLGFILSK